MGLTARRYSIFHGRVMARGFTLIELLVVLVIVGIALGLMAIRAMPDERQALQDEGQRVALLLQLARDEAIVRNRPVAFEAQTDRYRFLVYEDHQWQQIIRDELLRERAFQRGPVALAVAPPSVGEPLRIVFGREPVDKPFVLTLTAGVSSVSIRADGLGHFSVE